MIFKHEILRMSWSSWPPASIKASAESELEIFSKLNKIVRIKPQKSSDFLPSHLPWKLPKSSAGQQASSISGSPQDAAPTTACKAAWWARCAYHLQTKKCRMEMYGGTHLQGDRRICTMCKQDFDSIYVARPWTAKKHDIAWRHIQRSQALFENVPSQFQTLETRTEKISKMKTSQDSCVSITFCISNPWGCSHAQESSA